MHCPLLVRGQQYSNRENRKSYRLWYASSALEPDMLLRICHIFKGGGVNVTYLIFYYI